MNTIARRSLARISTAAFLAGVTTLAVSLPMPAAARSGASSEPVTSQALPSDPAEKH